MSLWDSLFGHLRQPVAQILITRNDIADVSWEGQWQAEKVELTCDVANAIPQRTKYVCGAPQHGSNTDRE